MSIAAETIVLADRSLRRYFRNPTLMIPTLAFPLLLMFMMLAVFGRLVGDMVQGGYIHRLAPLIVLSTASNGSMVRALGFFGDVRTGLLTRLRSMPISSGSLLGGRVAGDVTRVVGIGAVATLVASVLGFRFTQGPLAVLGYFGLLALVGAMFTWAAVLMAMVGSSPEGVQSSLNAPTTLLFFLSSGFVPVAAFPAVLQLVVRANPMSVATNALIGLSSGGPIVTPVLQTVAWTLGISAVCATLAISRYRALARR